MKRRKLQLERPDYLSVLVEQFLKNCKVRNLSERTIEHYRSSLSRFIEVVGDKPRDELRKEDIDSFVLSGRGLAAGTINGWLRDLKVFFNYANITIKPPMLKEPRKQIVPFSPEQITKLLKQPDKKTFVGLRDYTIMIILLDTGARIQEVLDLKKGDILIPSRQLLLTGKGNKQRIVPVGEECSSAINDYLQTVEDLPIDFPVFVTVNNLQLDRHQINKQLKKYAKQAGITGIRVSPHTFRHTFAKMFLLNGGDMFTLQKMLGHESLEMVRRYVNMFTGDMEEQHRKYSPVDKLKRRRRT